MVSKACYLAAYRRKLVEMAALPGVDLTLIVPPFWRMGERRALLEPGEQNGYRMLVDNPALNGRFHLHFYPRLGKRISDLRPDILHIDEEPYDLVTFHAVIAARRRGAKVVFFTWQNLDRSFPPPFGLIEKFVLSRAAGAIAGNSEAAGIIRRKGYRGPMATIPQFGVDPDIFDLPDSPGEARPFTVGFAGRLVREKGLTVLIEAISGLDGDWRLDIVGEGPLRGDIEQASRRAGVASRVRFLGGLPSQEMPAFYHGIDALVIPSLTAPNWKEQFGRVIIEAMACGVPVVGSDSGEIPNVIGDAGIVCPEGDSMALGAALIRLMRTPGLRAELSTYGRQRVLECYTHKRVAQDTLRLYEEVMKG